MLVTKHNKLKIYVFLGQGIKMYDQYFLQHNHSLWLCNSKAAKIISQPFLGFYGKDKKIFFSQCHEELNFSVYRYTGNLIEFVCICRDL